MKKKKPTKVVKLEVHHGGRGDEHWDKTVEGVIRKALEKHGEHRYSDIIIVGLQLDERGVARPAVFTFGDKLRGLGLLKWASDLIVSRFRS